ncbi:hypothetical protein [Chitinilyticum litopenaei]|uniref:hypothetical protein n=1 Tax=Chitinilyticum litopenaei TaxID=1121276 RepID=UPI0004070305|nr:hypothetical protein [Chitinilyticum litopenaei]
MIWLARSTRCAWWAGKYTRYPLTSCRDQAKKWRSEAACQQWCDEQDGRYQPDGWEEGANNAA